MENEEAGLEGARQFIFCICQAGVENTCKRELLQRHPSLSFAFSRPGFLTFRINERQLIPANFDMGSTFVRTWGWSIANFREDAAERLVDQVCQAAEGIKFSDLHVWQRDEFVPGQKGFEPGISPLSSEVASMVSDRLKKRFGRPELRVNAQAAPNDHVLDVVIVEPNHWWVGQHTANSIAQRWPGGVPIFESQEDLVSRSYLKLKESVLWSGIPLVAGDRCVEIGSAPGGACQALLEMGMNVLAVDPAELDETVMEHPNLTHLRRRGKDVRRKELENVKWLFTDINAVPNYTLEMVEDLCSREGVNFKGILLTLKMTDWKLAELIPEYLERVKRLGFGYVKSRQLAFDRKEICLLAMKHKSVRRRPKGRQKTVESDNHGV